MRRIPPFNGGLTAGYSHNTWGLAVWSLFAGAQNRLSPGDLADDRINNEGTPGWSTLNINAHYQWKVFRLNGGVRNILNTAYRMHGSGIDGTGRALWLSVAVDI